MKVRYALALEGSDLEKESLSCSTHGEMDQRETESFVKDRRKKSVARLKNGLVILRTIF